MKFKNICNKACGIVILVAALTLCGCEDDFPKLSDDQMDQAGEYAAVTLLRYDASNRSRLLSEEQIKLADERKAAWEEASNTVFEEHQEQEPETPSQGQNSTGEDGAGKEPVYHTMDDFFVLPDGVSVEYTGYQVCSSYLEDDSSFFSLDASEGKDILVLKFQMKNKGSADQVVDLWNRKGAYKITVNKTYTRSQLTTMLPNDMSTFQGTVYAGSAQELVLLTEIDKGTDINSMTLRLKNDVIECTILLK